jgi:hypothetical protein
MTTLTEIVAAVVVHSSAVALSHFGVTMEPAQVERPAAAPERVVARTPQHRPMLKTVCPELRRHSHSLKA